MATLSFPRVFRPVAPAAWLGRRIKRLRELAREFGRYLVGSPYSATLQRAALRELDDRMLRDIGLTRRDIARGRRAYD